MLFENITTEGLEELEFSGYSPLESGAYEAIVKMAYVTTSERGAQAVNIIANIGKREYRETLWVTNAKGENFYLDKQNGAKRPMAGYTIANNLTQICLGVPLKGIAGVERAVKIYSKEAKAEVPTTVMAIDGLFDIPVTLGILKEIHDKTTDDGNGKYVPTGDTREVNVINQVFSAETHQTAAEIEKKAEATAYDRWVAYNTGKTRNRSKGAANAGKQGAPQKPAKAPVKSLFA